MPNNANKSYEEFGSFFNTYIQKMLYEALSKVPPDERGGQETFIVLQAAHQLFSHNVGVIEARMIQMIPTHKDKILTARESAIKDGYEHTAAHTIGD